MCVVKESTSPRDRIMNRKAEQRARALSRRHFLRGVGVSIALPALASLPARSALAEPAKDARRGLATTASGAPLRMAFMSIPNGVQQDRKSTRLNSSHSQISYAVFCLKKK